MQISLSNFGTMDRWCQCFWKMLLRQEPVCFKRPDVMPYLDYFFFHNAHHHVRVKIKSHFYQSVDFCFYCHEWLDWEPKHLLKKTCNHTLVYFPHSLLLWLYLCSLFLFPKWYHSLSKQLWWRIKKGNKSITTAGIVLRLKRIKSTHLPTQTLWRSYW